MKESFSSSLLSYRGIYYKKLSLIYYGQMPLKFLASTTRFTAIR